MNRFAERLAASVLGNDAVLSANTADGISVNTALSATTAGGISGGIAAVICSDAALRQTVDNLGLPPITVLPSI